LAVTLCTVLGILALKGRVSLFVNKSLFVVHDSNPGYSAVIAHLLDVALRTPAIKNHIDLPVGVVRLGDADLSAPIASLVVSEVSQIPKFDPRLHLEKSRCVLTLSGCDANLLNQSGLSGSSIPVISLQKISFYERTFLKSPSKTFDEIVQVCSVAPTEATNCCDSRFRECCLGISDTAILIADCVSIFVQALMRSSDLAKTSRTD
jgi:hypothetical protein